MIVGIYSLNSRRCSSITLKSCGGGCCLSYGTSACCGCGASARSVDGCGALLIVLWGGVGARGVLFCDSGGGGGVCGEDDDEAAGCDAEEEEEEEDGGALSLGLLLFNGLKSVGFLPETISITLNSCRFLSSSEP